MDKKSASLPYTTDDDSLNHGDSFRKVLPTKPSTSLDSRLTMAGRMIERPSSGVERGTKYYAPYILEYNLLAEFLMLQNKAIPGIYVNAADKDPLLWYGVLFVHEGPYEGGVFRFRVNFSPTFPDGDFPRLTFDGKIFHPSISEDSGDLNVAAEFRTWRSGQNHVWQILQYAKDVFDKMEIGVPLNKEASEMLEHDPEAFEAKAKECVNYSKTDIYNVPESEDDINYIRFEPFNPITHGSVLSQLKLEACLQDS